MAMEIRRLRNHGMFVVHGIFFEMLVHLRGCCGYIFCQNRLATLRTIQKIIRNAMSKKNRKICNGRSTVHFNGFQ